MKIVAVTACPSGIAHTYMAAESLNIAAKKLGVSIKIETQGAIGIENELTNKDIHEADLIILAIDKEIEKERFNNNNVIQISTKEAIKNAENIISEYIKNVEANKKNKFDIYSKIMVGINYIVPIMILLAIIPNLKIGIDISLPIVWKIAYVILTVVISTSIADRIAVPVAIIGSIYVINNGGAFISSIIVGISVGLLTRLIMKYVKKIKVISGVLAMCIVPLVTYIIVLILIQLNIDGIVLFIDTKAMRLLMTDNIYIKLILVLIGSIMISYDLGGRINKIAYIVAICSIGVANESYLMASVIIAGMIPPIALSIYNILLNILRKETINKNYITAFVQGLFFVSEGAITLREQNNKLYFLPTIIGAVGGGLISVFTNVKTVAPHGGILTLIVPGIVQGPIWFVLSILAGVIITILSINISKLIKNRTI